MIAHNVKFIEEHNHEGRGKLISSAKAREVVLERNLEVLKVDGITSMYNRYQIITRSCKA